MGMNRNEAYLYAMSIRDKHLSNARIELMMKSQGHTPDCIRQVKWWLSHDSSKTV